jgi:hypothetical protein
VQLSPDLKKRFNSRNIALHKAMYQSSMNQQFNEGKSCLPAVVIPAVSNLRELHKS